MKITEKDMQTPNFWLMDRAAQSAVLRHLGVEKWGDIKSDKAAKAADDAVEALTKAFIVFEKEESR